MDCVTNPNYLVEPNHLALAPSGFQGECASGQKAGYRESDSLHRIFATVTMNEFAKNHDDFFASHIESRWRFFKDVFFTQSDMVWNVFCSVVWSALFLVTGFQSDYCKNRVIKCAAEVRLAAASSGDALIGMFSPSVVARSFERDFLRGRYKLNQVRQAAVLGGIQPVRSIDPNHEALRTKDASKAKRFAMRYSTTLRSTFSIIESNQYTYQNEGWFARNIETRFRFAKNALLAYMRVSWAVNKFFFMAICSLFTLTLVEGINRRVQQAFYSVVTLQRCFGDSIAGIFTPRQVTKRFLEDYFSGWGRLRQLGFQQT